MVLRRLSGEIVHRSSNRWARNRPDKIVRGSLISDGCTPKCIIVHRNEIRSGKIKSENVSRCGRIRRRGTVASLIDFHDFTPLCA
jgi:hypothetical protein